MVGEYVSGAKNLMAPGDDVDIFTLMISPVYGFFMAPNLGPEQSKTMSHSS